jgi:hypothetical protein
MAGRAGPVLQRGQDENRPPQRRVRLPRLELPPLPRPQAADQAVQGGHQEAPETARGRDAQAARRERGGGHRHAQPRHPGMDGLPPGNGVQPDLRITRALHMAAHLQVGTMDPPEERRPLGRQQVLREVLPVRDDKWVFGNRDTGAYLLRHSWTGIRRHVMVKGWASPDDPDLAGYWENRRRGNGPPLDAGTLSLLGRQQNRCPSCGDLLIDATHLPASPEGGKTGGSASPARTPSAQPARRKSPCRRRQAGPSLS